MATAGPQVTAIVCAYNEAANIGGLLETLLGRDAHAFDDLVVVSSGSTDGTDDIVRGFLNREPRLRLISEPARAGKAAAVSAALAGACAETVLLIDADCVPGPGSLEALGARLQEAGIGGAGARNVVTNRRESVVARAGAVLWELHHEVCLREPVLGGDIVAFRRVMDELPVGTVNDDYVIEAALKERGLAIAYEPRARVLMRVPTTVQDFMRQRRRIFAGYRAETRAGAVKATQRGSLILAAGLAVIRRRPFDLPWLALLVALEAAARLSVLIDEKSGRAGYYVAWTPATSTKGPVSIESTE